MRKLLVAIAILPLMAAVQPASAWTISQNFDDEEVGRACGWGAGGGSTVSTTEAYSGNGSCRLSVTGGKSAFGEWGGVLNHPSDLRRGQEIWVRLRTFMPTGFDYNSYGEGNHLKFLRVHTMSPSVENFGYDDIYINPQGRMPPFKFIYEGEQVWSPIGTSSDVISLGRWETYEYYVRLDTVPASRGGMARVRFWKNGKLLADIADRQTLRSTDGYADRTHIFTYWNGDAPKTQHMFIDDLVITSDTPAARDAAGNPFVGMGAAAIRPVAPTSLTVN